MKSYQVMFVLPCEQPEQNVVKRMRKTTLLFEVPINYPNYQDVGIAELLRVAKDAKLFTESTALNKNIDKPNKKT